MRRALASILLLVAFLLSFAGSASAYVDYGAKNRVGSFGDPFAPQVGFADPLALELHQENTIAVYDPVTGVLFYVRQNPWTMVDPLGLFGGAPGLGNVLALNAASSEADKAKYAKELIRDSDNFREEIQAQIDFTKTFFTNPKELANEETMTKLAMAYIVGGVGKKGRGRGKGGSPGGQSAKNQVKDTTPEPYEVDSYSNLQKGDVVGDKLGNHHTPQKAKAKKIVGKYPQDKLAKDAPAIRLPDAEHAKITKLQSKRDTSKMNARQLLADDVKQLRNNTNAPPKQLKKLIKLNKEKYDYSKKQK